LGCWLAGGAQEMSKRFFTRSASAFGSFRGSVHRSMFTTAMKKPALRTSVSSRLGSGGNINNSLVVWSPGGASGNHLAAALGVPSSCMRTSMGRLSFPPTPPRFITLSARPTTEASVDAEVAAFAGDVAADEDEEDVTRLRRRSFRGGITGAGNPNGGGVAAFSSSFPLPNTAAAAAAATGTAAAPSSASSAHVVTYRLRFKAFAVGHIQDAIVKTQKLMNAKLGGDLTFDAPVFLPRRTRRYTVLASPMIDKHARDQFEQRIYSQLVHVSIAYDPRIMRYLESFLYNYLYFTNTSISVTRLEHVNGGWPRTNRGGRRRPASNLESSSTTMAAGTAA